MKENKKLVVQVHPNAFLIIVSKWFSFDSASLFLPLNLYFHT